MRLKLRFLLTGCLLGCLWACGTNNNPNPQTTSSTSTTTTNTQASQPGVIQPTAAETNEAGAPATPGAPNLAANETATTGGIDACSLITKQEMAKIQGGAIKETKSNQRHDGEFLMSQCFYTAEEFVRSVSLSVIQANPANPNKQPKDYFMEKFRDAGKKSATEREKERERERERERAKERKAEGENQAEREEEEEEGANVERVGGIGDQAYWVKSGPSALLYVLKKNQFIILSIGGSDADSLKLRKTKALAQQALKRLK